MMSITCALRDGQSFASILKRNGDDKKGITFINGSSDKDFLSYRDLYNKACFLSDQLINKNIKAGDEVVLQIEDNKTFLTAFWACLIGNLIPVPPIIMMLRLPFGGVTPLQWVGSVMMLMLSFLIITWLAARIYRVGILSTGKKASFKDLAKWFSMKV